MLSYSVKDYTNLFQYKELDRIRGQPTLDSLTTLLRQVKINAQSVPTILGGGQYGYLALVLSDATYSALPNTVPFIRPVHPGVFSVTVPSTTGATTRTATLTSITSTQVSNVTIANQKAIHDENLRLYHECQTVEKALRQQIIDSIHSDYLEALRNRETCMINNPISVIIAFLQQSYGKITEQEFYEKEDDIKKFRYDPELPVDTVFNRIDKFQAMCELTGNSKSDRQLVSLAYFIFSNTGIFMNALKKWNKKTIAHKTYIDMVIHMRDQHQALREVGALKIKDSQINQALMLQKMATQQQELAETIKTDISDQVRSSLLDTILMLKEETDFSTLPEIKSVSTDSVNSVSTLSTMESMITLIKNLEKKVESLSNAPNVPNNNKNINDINPKTGKAWKRYCWTCGCCNHWGKTCPNPASGHENGATFKNRMNGSNKDCL